MPVTAIISVSFQSVPAANNAIDVALCGSASPAQMTGPFTKEGTTATYRCETAADAAATNALQNLFTALNNHAASLDSLTMSIVKFT